MQRKTDDFVVRLTHVRCVRVTIDIHGGADIGMPHKLLLHSNGRTDRRVAHPYLPADYHPLEAAPPFAVFEGWDKVKNRPASFGYDAAENLTQEGPGSPSWTYTYDAENRISSIAGSASETFKYDGDGERVYKSYGAIFWRLPGGPQLHGVSYQVP